ncbi:HAD-IIB family hydrolase [Sodalinema gerasimenkoae]|uniref:HAD-IIB family hydrolase n=1 Tax=Sodalinema gerasimenkoae TaxID=2862348 RepID=UPI00135CB66C|nr:HAD-IIB family hydrolase [Sodalinema gerasimenkoae]
MTLVVFTDLDGTLLNSHDYRFDEAIPTLTLLKQRNIPIIPVTSKTRVEVEPLLKDLQLQEPFIIENGSGVFIHPEDKRFNLKETESWQGYRLKRFGCLYSEARSGLAQLSQQLGVSLQGFGDLTVADLTALTGLSPQAAQQAQTREFSEPFITPQQQSSREIEQAVTKLGFRVVVGDRFSHLIGPQAGKGTAVCWLLNQFQDSRPRHVIGLGNSPNDLDMLEAVESPIIIPNNKGLIHPGLQHLNAQIAPHAGARGWAAAIAPLLAQ